MRAFVQQLWSRYEPYCGDANFLGEARRQFQQFTWQMYVGVCLLEAGHILEKAAPESGQRFGLNALLPSQVQARTSPSAPPDDKIQARLTGAVFTKAQQHRNWVKNGVVSADDAFIIAIGAGVIPDTDLALDPPHIVRALFGVAGPAINPGRVPPFVLR